MKYFRIFLFISLIGLLGNFSDHYQEIDFNVNKSEFLFFSPDQYIFPDYSNFNYDIKFIKLDIEAFDTSVLIQGSASILAEVTGFPLDTFRLELVDAYTIDSIILNNEIVSFTHFNDIIKIPVGTSIPIGELVEVTTYYRGEGGSSSFFSGITNRVDPPWEIPVTWTLSEPFGAKEWFPCKQDLYDKIDSVHVFITTDPHLKAGSVGLLTNITTLPDGRIRHEWKHYYPIAFYLISIAVADYQEYNIYAPINGGKDSLLIQNYIYNRPGVLDHYKDQIDKTIDLMVLFSDLFGEYPFINEKYGHCLAPMGGGMEHQTMSTMANFNFGLVAHELAHMWFGNSVTCATWNDIWINEGFASYSEYLAYENLYSAEVAASWLEQAHERALIPQVGSVYVPQSEVNDKYRIFDGNLSYKKGAALLHMLRNEIQDDELFFGCIRNYLSEFRDSIATGMDFKYSLEQCSGIDFTNFFNQWYYGEGHPIYNVAWSGKGDSLRIEVVQTSSSTVTPVFKTHIDIQVVTNLHDTVFRVYHGGNSEKYMFYLPGNVEQVVFDPQNWLLKRATVYEINTIEGQFIVYPNPSNGLITVEFPDDNVTRQIDVTSLSGQPVKSISTSKKLVSFDLSTMAAGIYVINVLVNNKKHFAKIVKH